jgi:signal transduction histidine kinase/CheY-like chemotaxis protein
MERTITWIAGIAAALVAAAFPISHYLFGLASVDSTLRTEAEINARLITQIINANPELWQFEVMRLEEMLAKRPSDGTPETRRLYSLDGTPIAPSDDALPPPLRTHAAPVQDSGRAVGRIEIARSLRPLLQGTAMAALSGVLLAAGLFYALRVLPLRSLRRTLSELVVERERTFGLQRERDAAAAGARVKSEFLACMSHEIRTPMNGVLGMTELLLNSPLDERQRRFAETAHSSGRALLKIIDDILDFSKIEAGKLELERLTFSPLELAEDIVQILAPRAFGKGLDIGILIAPEVPECLEGDPGRTRQVLTNLLGNAIKFTEQGEVCLALDLERDEQGGTTQVRFAVRDTGIGIAAAALARLFDPFVQGDRTTTRRFGGTGLGLAISRQLAQAMGGKLVVDSCEGKGSTFTFTLPVQAEPVAQASPSVVHPPRLAFIHRGALSERAVQDALLRIGATSEPFESVAQALVAIRAAAGNGNPYSVVLLGVDHSADDVSGLTGRIQVACGPTRPTIIHLQRMMAASEPARTRPDVVQVPARCVELRALLLRCGARLATTHAAAGSTTESDALRGRQVLVVEDNEVNQLVASAMLKSFGVRCEVAADGADALALLEQREFDLVLMDCQMPGMDGFEATRRIRARERGGGGRQIIVALTANVMTEDRALCIDAGMDDFLPKPMTVNALRAVLRRWLVPVDATVLQV